MANQNRRAFFKKLAVSGAGISLAAGSSEGKAAKAAEKVDRRMLGRIGEPVSILGLGLGSAFTGPFGGDAEGTEAILERALENGVNYWDTAQAYGPSEKMIGPLVKKHRKDIFLVSKSARRDYDGFWRELEASLKDLQTDRIDLYHIHNLKPSRDGDLTRIEKGAVKAAREAKDQGIIKAFGITGHSGAAILMEAIRQWDPDALLTVFPADRPDNGRYEDLLLPLARERNMGVIGMKTVRWARNTDLTGSRLIRYALSLEGVASVIVGLDGHAHLDENCRMATRFKPLPKDEQAYLNDAVKKGLDPLGPAPWDRPGYDDVVRV